MDLTFDQLKEALLGKDYPSNIQINPATIVIEADPFLEIQFDMLTRHKGDIYRSAAWQRLREFYTATHENG